MINQEFSGPVFYQNIGEAKTFFEVELPTSFEFNL